MIDYQNNENIELKKSIEETKSNYNDNKNINLILIQNKLSQLNFNYDSSSTIKSNDNNDNKNIPVNSDKEEINLEENINTNNIQALQESINIIESKKLNLNLDENKTDNLANVNNMTNKKNEIIINKELFDDSNMNLSNKISNKEKNNLKIYDIGKKRDTFFN